MKKASTFIGIILLIVIAIFVYSNLTKKKSSLPESANNKSNGEVVCTQDAKLCPDGSYVARSGPQCEFAKCPTVGDVKTTTPKSTGGTSSKDPKTFKTVLANSFFYDGITITPLQVLEDSRCPIGANCIWAGKVNLSIKIETNSTPKISQTSEISLTNSVVFQNKKISLLTMTPLPVAGRKTLPAEYSFEFSVANK